MATEDVPGGWRELPGGGSTLASPTLRRRSGHWVRRPAWFSRLARSACPGGGVIQRGALAASGVSSTKWSFSRRWRRISYGRGNRQSIAARETRVAARLRAVDRGYRTATEHRHHVCAIAAHPSTPFAWASGRQRDRHGGRAVTRKGMATNVGRDGNGRIAAGILVWAATVSASYPVRHRGLEMTLPGGNAEEPASRPGRSASRRADTRIGVSTTNVGNSLSERAPPSEPTRGSVDGGGRGVK